MLYIMIILFHSLICVQWVKATLILKWREYQCLELLLFSQNLFTFWSNVINNTTFLSLFLEFI